MKILWSMMLFLAFPMVVALAAPPSEIIILATFDFPGTGNSTFANGINNRDDVSGDYRDPAGGYHGFLRLRSGRFLASNNQPSFGHLLELFGINDARTAVGRIVGSSRFHGERGFFVNGRTFSYYDFQFDTALLGINDKENFGGYASYGLAFGAFVSIDGTASFIDFPGSPFISETRALNNSDQAVGRYQNPSPDFTVHGFVWNPDGTLTAPIDYPGATDTELHGISDTELLVGNYNNADKVQHACVIALPDIFLSYDYPGATATTFNGVNANGLTAGTYTDAAGVSHGIIAQVK